MQLQIESTTPVLGIKELAINNWLLERHKLLIAYCELAGITPNEQDEGALPHDLHIKHFCQILMDYISAGHFEIFEKIINDAQYSTCNTANALHNIYSKILVSTDLALQFNDKYAENVKDEHLDAFDNCLSILGKHLEQRFELEDQLVKGISVT